MGHTYAVDSEWLGMRTFRCNLDLCKSTDNKFRWDEDVDGTKFSLYVPKLRVPEPTPPMIGIKLYDATGLDPSQQLTPVQRAALLKAGMADEQVSELDKWLPVSATKEPHSDRPIIAAVKFYKIHTQTVRYKPIGDPESWEIGEPYVPISALPFDYPLQLILRVTWMY